MSSPKETAIRLYQEVIHRTREEFLYSSFMIPDTFECRFEVMCLHTFFIMERLSIGDEFLRSIRPELSNAVFSGLEIGLREQGIGDFGIGPKMNRFSKNFWGRMRAYEQATWEGDFKIALWKNLFSKSASKVILEEVNSYCLLQMSHLSSLSDNSIKDSRNPFIQKKD